MRRVACVVVSLFVLAACDVTGMVLRPREGSIVSGPTVVVSGVIPADLAVGGTLRVNGQPVPVAADRTWSTEIPTVTDAYVTPFTAVYREPGKSYTWDQTSAVVTGPHLDEGQASPEGVGLRVTNTGLAGLGPVIRDLASGAFDIGGLLLAQNPIIEEENAILTVDVTGNAYEAGIGGVDISAASTATGVSTRITIDDLYVGVNLELTDGLLIDADCGLELQLPVTTIDATFDLGPAAEPSVVDVNLVSAPTVNTGTVGYEFTSGICDSDVFLIGDIVNLVAGPQIQALVASGFAQQLGDPDGAGPNDSPIADAIETALAEISIAGSVGEAIKVNLAAPFTQVTEGADALEFRANADFFTTVGTGPSDCQPPAGAPDLTETFDVAGTFPTFGPTTPSGAPYGLGLAISSSAFNQLLGSLTECGVINRELTEIAIGGGPPVPITSTLLAAIVPEFATRYPAGTPVRIQVTPTVAPFLTAAGGPNGEPSELVLANLRLDFVVDTAIGPVVVLGLAVDAPLGFDLDFDAAADALAPVITAPVPSDVDVRVVRNTIDTNAAALETLFPQLFPQFVGDLSSAFAAFPLPAFLGLSLDVVEVARQGTSYVLYANLVPVPRTRLENFALTDLSSADSATDVITDVNEWRHRIRPTYASSQARVDFKGMVGADACCFTGSESRSARAGYRLTFDVVPENGETWRVDVGQSIAGAHTLIDEQLGRASTSITTITGRARVGTGPVQVFDVTPSATSASSSGNVLLPFTGANALALQGNTRQTITIEFGFDVSATSSSTVFPPVAGDEAAVRFGANDTIANGFTAGEYPGVGNRNIVTDGHFATVGLTVIP